MRKDFDANMPAHEQLLSANQRRKVGRKHNHTLGPGKAALKAQRKRTVISQRLAAAARRYKAQIAAYWRGESDTYPQQKP